jgi:hypothetical protein
MDPEIQREYEEHMRTMVDLLNQQATATSKLLNSLQTTSTATNAVNANTVATKKQTEAMSGSTKAMEAGAAAQQKYAEAAANFSRGLISGQAAALGFGKALIDSQKNLEKYGSAFDSAGDAAWDIGKNFGILGMAVGSLAKGVGFLAGGMFKAVDSVVQFRDETARLGGVMPTTLSGMQELGSNARFSGEEIMKLTKVMSGFGTSIIGLGGTAGEGQIKFMQMAAVTDDVRRKFGRLGVDQDRLLEMQGMYIQMQGISGKALENRTKTEGQLQRESLAYAKNLIIMSDLTGQNAEQMQQEREVVKAEFEEQVKIRQENIQIQRLRAAGEREAADAIKKEQDNRTHLIQTMTDTYGKDIGSQFGRLARTGVYDEFTSGLATLGISATEVSNLVKTSGNIQADSLRQVDKVTNLQNNMVERVGASFQFMGEESARSLLGSTEAITKGNNLFGKSVEEEVVKIEQTVAEKEAEGDAMADAVERIRSAEREIQKLYYDSMYALAEIVVPKFAGALEWATTKLIEMIDYLKANFDDIVKQIQKWGPIVAAAAGSLVAVFLSLKIGKGVSSIFSGIIGAGRGLISWMRRVTRTPLGGGAYGPDSGGSDGDRKGKGARGAKLLRFAKGAAGGIGGLLGGLALDYGAEKATEAGYVKTGAGLNTASYAATGAGLGAMLGPLGALVGGLAGGAYGLYQNWNTLTGANESKTEDQMAAAAGQTRAAETSQTASKGMAAASENFAITVANLERNNEESYEKIIAAAAKAREETSEETEKQTGTAEKNKKSSETFVKSANKFDKNILTWAKITYAFAKANLSFALTVVDFNKSIKDFKLFVDEKLMSVGGTYGTQFGGDVDRILSTIRQRESGNDYTAKAKGSSASGAYQFIDSTWQNLTKKFGIGTEYSTARDAPAPVQDQVAAAYVKDILERAGGDVSKVPLEWYTGNIQGKMSPAAIAANNGLTAGQYQANWMKDFAKTSPTSGIGQPSPGSDAIVRLGRSLQEQGLRISGHSQFGGQERGRHSSNSLHYKDLAIDVNVGTGIREADHPEHGQMFDALANQLRSSGYNVMWRGDGHDDHMHVSVSAPKGVKAARGGVFSGASSGYPATLHGTEMVAPLTMDSILMKLAKTSALSAEGDMIEKVLTGGGTGAAENSNTDAMLKMHSELISVISSKLDSMIDAIDDGNSTRTRILRNSMV